MAKQDRKTKKASLSKKQAANIFAKLEAAEPLLEGNDQVREVEDSVCADGLLRRVVLASMKFSGRELVEMTKDDDAALVLAIAEAAGRHWIERTRTLVEIIESQHARLATSLCYREDMQSLRLQAEAEIFEMEKEAAA